eukprot:CAMPEP_0197614610 /NCGR_PEP_ID=MMETSP1326-20131121/59612_1 /TAXON_ID=1155430 /ORGANISM="Genus nov. species nov., Strain RCC2288" /LENGTH=103 /DNA_ID=CAMNT_0043183483 /DNA_START=277 /DNA_END=588 /DNA_ORIENTATION=+
MASAPAKMAAVATKWVQLKRNGPKHPTPTVGVATLRGSRGPSLRLGTQLAGVHYPRRLRTGGGGKRQSTQGGTSTSTIPLWDVTRDALPGNSPLTLHASCGQE